MLVGAASFKYFAPWAGAEAFSSLRDFLVVVHQLFVSGATVGMLAAMAS